MVWQLVFAKGINSQENSWENLGLPKHSGGEGMLDCPDHVEREVGDLWLTKMPGLSLILSP